MPLPTAYLEMERAAPVNQLAQLAAGDARLRPPFVAERTEEGSWRGIEKALRLVDFRLVHVDCPQRLAVALLHYPLMDALVAPQGIVEAAEEEEAGEVDGIVDGGAQQLHLILHFQDGAPANVDAMFQEMDIGSFAQFQEGRDVALLVDMDEEVSLVVESLDKAPQLGGVGVGGDEEC